MVQASADLLDTLSRRSLFVGLTAEQLRCILAASELRRYAPGEEIIAQGEDERHLYCILAGGVSVAVEDSTGEVHREVITLNGGHTLENQHVGDCFGEMSVLDFEPTSAHVVACAATETLVTPARALEELFEADRNLHLVLLSNIARTLSRRARMANGRRTDASGINRDRLRPVAEAP